MKQKLRLGDSYALLITNQRNQSTTKLPSQTGGNARMVGHQPHLRISTKRNEESCVCTHAKVPAHSGLGLALGLMVTLFLKIMCLETRAQRPETSGPVPPGMIVLFLLMALSLSGKAQFYKPSNVSVQIGKALPESFYNAAHQAVNMQTGEEVTLQMAAYRDKLIILDFWASWCGPCIHSLNKLDSLKRNEEQEGYVVIPVTYQSKSEASRAYWKYQWNFTGIVGDTTLGKIFPHSGLPHMVWIKDGKVLSIPRSSYVTGEGIRSAIEGKLPNMPQMKMTFDAAMSIYHPNNAGYKGDAHFQSTLATGNPDFYQQTPQIVEKDGTIRLSAVNMPLPYLVYYLFKTLELKKGRQTGFGFELSDRAASLLKRLRPKSDDFEHMEDYRQAHAEWTKQYRYTYCLQIPASWGEETAYEMACLDMNRFLRLHFGLEATLQTATKPKLIIH